MNKRITKIFCSKTDTDANTNLFQKTHKKLTLLFTGVSGLILAVMSCCYLYMSEYELKQDSFMSFLNESNTIIANFEHNSTISYGWLSKVSAGNRFILAVYDNGMPLDYTNTTLTGKEKAVAGSVLSTAKKYFNKQSDDYASLIKNFSYTT